MTKTSTHTPRDVHAEITNHLIAAIEADPGKPTLPWRRTGGALFAPSNALTGKAYRGINILSLWVAAETLGYSAPLWATYRQWAEKGAQVRKGERASLIIFYKEFETDPDPKDSSDDGRRRMARASYVFNAAQVDGFEAPASVERLGPVQRIEAADAFVSQTKARVRMAATAPFTTAAPTLSRCRRKACFLDRLH